RRCKSVAAGAESTLGKTVHALKPAGVIGNTAGPASLSRRIHNRTHLLIDLIRMRKQLVRTIGSACVRLILGLGGRSQQWAIVAENRELSILPRFQQAWRLSRRGNFRRQGWMQTEDICPLIRRRYRQTRILGNGQTCRGA